MAGKGAAMNIEQGIDDLIKAGWNVLRSDFDLDAFEDWRMKASLCVNALLGPDHDDTKPFHGSKQNSRKTHFQTRRPATRCHENEQLDH